MYILCPSKHELPGQNRAIPGSLHGHTLKIGQKTLHGLSMASLAGWHKYYVSLFTN